MEERLKNGTAGDYSLEMHSEAIAEDDQRVFDCARDIWMGMTTSAASGRGNEEDDDGMSADEEKGGAAANGTTTPPLLEQDESDSYYLYKMSYFCYEKNQ